MATDRLNAIAHLKTHAKAWSRSNQGKENVKEWGFTITKTKDGQYYIGHELQEGDENHVKIEIDIDEDKEELIGTGHVHPYSKKQGSHLGIAHSSGDIDGTRYYADVEGFVDVVFAGNKMYAIVVEDSEKAMKFYDKNPEHIIKNKYQKISDDPENSQLSFGEKVKKAIKKIIGDSEKSGLGLYKTIDEDNKVFKKVE